MLAKANKMVKKAIMRRLLATVGSAGAARGERDILLLHPGIERISQPISQESEA